jgi:hypothetical protein
MISIYSFLEVLLGVVVEVLVEGMSKLKKRDFGTF